jgi:hypothetical protein
LHSFTIFFVKGGSVGELVLKHQPKCDTIVSGKPKSAMHEAKSSFSMANINSRILYVGVFSHEMWSPW